MSAPKLEAVQPTKIAALVLDGPKKSESHTLDALYKLAGLVCKHCEAQSDEVLLWIQVDAVLQVVCERVRAEHTALVDLVRRCDGSEGVRADGSNIDTLRAHAALDAGETNDTP